MSERPPQNSQELEHGAEEETNLPDKLKDLTERVSSTDLESLPEERRITIQDKLQLLAGGLAVAAGGAWAAEAWSLNLRDRSIPMSKNEAIVRMLELGAAALTTLLAARLAASRRQKV
ncbi:hypothetical protein HY504_02830 [Candidatus Wolfebacteria bacterium]|nr:hypothetical protein [Candidatus Wolfebacteria bacterium]